MADENYRIQELLQREVYVGDNLVGTIVGERYHPNEDRVRSMRIQVQPNVAEEYMRKPAEHAPLSKELIHSIQDDGEIQFESKNNFTPLTNYWTEPYSMTMEWNWELLSAWSKSSGHTEASQSSFAQQFDADTA